MVNQNNQKRNEEKNSASSGTTQRGLNGHWNCGPEDGPKYDCKISSVCPGKAKKGWVGDLNLDYGAWKVSEEPEPRSQNQRE